MLSSSMLPLNLILLIDVTFSTATGDYTQVPSADHDECNGILQQQCVGRLEREGWAEHRAPLYSLYFFSLGSSAGLM
jgi:hypothetical protein